MALWEQMETVDLCMSFCPTHVSELFCLSSLLHKPSLELGIPQLWLPMGAREKRQRALSVVVLSALEGRSHEQEHLPMDCRAAAQRCGLPREV